MLGLALGWAILLWVAFRIRRWALRFLETQDERGVGKTGKKWEQDKPMAECFDKPSKRDRDNFVNESDDWWYE